MNKNVDWKKWCEDLWKESADQWIQRTGQDHYYREYVVLPTLLNAINGLSIQTLADIGSGDGYTTNLLLQRLEQMQQTPQKVVLIDRSAEQLEKTKTVPSLHQAKTIVADLESNDWSSVLSKDASPKLLLSTFVYQEIPNISLLFQAIGSAMHKSDLCLSVIVNPEYSTLLRSQNKVQLISSGTDQNDWEWVGKYPIGVEGGTIYLPHFERKLKTYKKLAEKNGLVMREPVFCRVPDTQESRKIFGETVYGNEIIGVDSSVLLSFIKK